MRGALGTRGATHTQARAAYNEKTKKHWRTAFLITRSHSVRFTCLHCFLGRTLGRLGGSVHSKYNNTATTTTWDDDDPAQNSGGRAGGKRRERLNKRKCASARAQHALTLGESTARQIFPIFFLHPATGQQHSIVARSVCLWLILLARFSRVFHFFSSRFDSDDVRFSMHTQ